MNKLKIVLIILIPLILVAQTQRWGYFYNGTAGSLDDAYRVVYGEDGNIYTTGFSMGSGGGSDFVIISVNSAGSERWVYRFNDPGNNDATGQSLVYGSDGNIHATGYQLHNDTSDFVVLSVTATGTQRWVSNYAGSGEDNAGNAICYGNDGNIYATGFSSAGNVDLTVISLTANGTQRWIYNYSGLGNSDDRGNSILYGPDGNIYIAGRSSVNNNPDFIVISLTSSGTERWVYRYNGPGNSEDVARALVYGTDGNIYAAGYSVGTALRDFTVISLTTSGNERWVYRYNRQGNENDEAYSLIYGLDGNIYAAGYCGGSNDDDCAVISLTNTGSERWVYIYNGTGNIFDRAYALDHDQNNNIYAAASTCALNSDFTVISLTSTGTQRWLYSYNGTGNATDEAYDIVYGADGNVYAAGNSRNPGKDIAIISLTSGSGIEENSMQPLPNSPFRITASTIQNRNLTYQLSALEPLTLKLSLFTVQGEKIISWEHTCQKGISNNTKRTPAISPGVYFIRAETSRGEKDSKKIIIAK